jgi:hypothetical protein
MNEGLLSALYDMTNANGTPNEILKAMIAGDQSGRELNNQLTGSQALKPESLDSVLKQLEYTQKQIVLWNKLPKKSVYNTVHEYLQLVKYGQNIGIFMAEGDRPENTDSQYRRKSVLTKYMGVGGKLTHQAMLVKNADGKDPYTREVENKLLLLTKLIDMKLWEGNSNTNGTDFDGFDRQHILGINEIYGDPTGKTAEQLFDTYFGDPAVINANGKALTETMGQEAAHAIVNDRFGEATMMITNPTVLKDFNARFYEKQRILLGTAANSGLQAGQSVNSLKLQFGDVPMESDVFFDRKEAIAYNRAATSGKAPAAPTTNSIAAVSADTKNKFGSAHAGGYFYVVTAKNQYGESAPLAINTNIQAVAATESLDITFVAGSGNYAATGFVVYRTTKTPANRLTAKYYPVFEVSVAELAAGFDGAAAGTVRDRNRFIAGTHCAMILDPTDQIWEYIQLMPTSKVEFALTTLAKEFAILNYGSPVLYAPGKISVIRNIGSDITA